MERALAQQLRPLSTADVLRLPRAPQVSLILETTSADSAQKIAPRVLTGLEHAPLAKLHSLSTQTVLAHARRNNI